MDALGVRHPRASAHARIACLVPSLTELLCALGLTDQLVARTGFCIHPREQVAGIPKVGGTKDVDLERLRALAPTHVVLNIDENTRPTADALREFVPHLIVTHPQAPEDNCGLYRLFGAIFDREEAAAALCAELAAALQAVAQTPQAEVRRVLYLIWRGPWMSVSRETYISRTLARFGWATMPDESTVRYPEVNLEEMLDSVDEVLLSSEPYPFRETHAGEIRALRPHLPVRIIDGEMTSWYGVRAIQGLRYLQRFTRESMASAGPATRIPAAPTISAAPSGRQSGRGSA